MSTAIKRQLVRAAWCASLATLGATPGCLATVEPAPVTYIATEYDAYPYEYYDGRRVYLINDHWYYRDGPRWYYYHTEPPVLYRRRLEIRQAPPAHVPAAPYRHAPDVRRAAPPAHR